MLFANYLTTIIVFLNYLEFLLIKSIYLEKLGLNKEKDDFEC